MDFGVVCKLRISIDFAIERKCQYLMHKIWKANKKDTRQNVMFSVKIDKDFRIVIFFFERLFVNS